MSQPQGDPKLTEAMGACPRESSTPLPGKAPSDAIVLFDGSDLSEWSGGWKIDGDAVTVVPGHRESWSPNARSATSSSTSSGARRASSKVEGQGRGNSGVFLMERYEVQVLDSYENTTYVERSGGRSLYKQHIPLVNASRPPGTWQSYDIIFMAPRFHDDGSVAEPATMTVFHNGVLIQNHVEVQGKTENVGQPKYVRHDAKAPLMLQDHTNR